MKKMAFCAAGAAVLSAMAASAFEIDKSVMSDEYWKVWNDAEQARIDADIERNRKADAHVAVAAPDGSEVTVEQLGHDFRFGAHIFNFNQLGKTEYNDAYKSMYGRGGLFNQATVAFYWLDYEPTPGGTRADGSYRDTEEYWNARTREQALEDRFWRRPAPAPVVDFLKSRDVAIHGHILVWGLAKPFWIYDCYCPEDEKRVFDALGIPRHSAFCGATCTCARRWNVGYPKATAVAWAKAYADTDEAELAQKTPVYAKRLRELFRNRVAGVAARFGAFADSWDVVNESADDWAKYGTSRTGLAYCFSSDYGLMPGDYQLNAFLDAQEFLPPTAKLAINDWRIREEFLDQVADLAKEGARVDLVGCQMHLFDTNMCAKLARGETDVSWVGSPKAIRDRLDLMAKTGRRLHVSEVTIAAPGEDERSRQIQAVLVRNIYRAWFSHPKTMGVTWWNTVDGAGFAGEPLVSGLWTVDMKKKPAYDALDQLINHEWRTNLRLAAKDGFVDFRGFRGKYRIGWTCATCGGRHVREVYLTGDGLREPAMDAAALPCARVVRRFTVDGKPVALPPGEDFLDLGKIYPQGLGGNGVDGQQWADVSFVVDAPAAGTYRLDVNADWWSQFVLDDGKVVDHGGPFVAELPLKAGRNEIRYRSRAGSAGKWNVRIKLPYKSGLKLR